MGKKIENKAKVKTVSKEPTVSDLKKMGVVILPDDYLSDVEKYTFTRINGKPLLSWVMSINEFLKLNKGKKIYIYPQSEDNIYWKTDDNKVIFIRGYTE